MCGICGKIDFDRRGINEDLFKKMCQSFSCRGQDDHGTFISPPVGLGHRRLSIIGLSRMGRQPMSNEDETIWLVLNGEIYNFIEVRQKLKTKGYTMKSRTDTETIIHLYEEEGIDCLKHLNGMFAFALWDGPRQKLWLVRDRLGIKPLNYYWDGRKLVFGSEIKAILCDPEVTREIDYEALDLYLTLNYIPAPWTIFKNIRKLMLGSYLVVEKGEIYLENYWYIPASIKDSDTIPATETSDQEIQGTKKHLYTLLQDAVSRRLISDVPLGAFLSDGIDSSIIVALMARNSARPVKTFSIGFKGLPSFEETKYARGRLPSSTRPNTMSLSFTTGTSWKRHGLGNP